MELDAGSALLTVAALENVTAGGARVIVVSKTAVLVKARTRASNSFSEHHTNSKCYSFLMFISGRASLVTVQTRPILMMFNMKMCWVWIILSDDTVQLMAHRQRFMYLHGRWASWEVTFIILANLFTPTALLAYQFQPSNFIYGCCQKEWHLSSSLERNRHRDWNTPCLFLSSLTFSHHRPHF